METIDEFWLKHYTDNGYRISVNMMRLKDSPSSHYEIRIYLPNGNILYDEDIIIEYNTHYPTDAYLLSKIRQFDRQQKLNDLGI